MSGGYIESLEQLLAQVDGVLEDQGNMWGEEPAALEHIRQTRDFWTDRPTPEEYEQLFTEIREAYREVVREVEEAWGAPDFIADEHERSLVPPFAIEAACWKRGDSVACVYYEHQDRELPICLILAAFDFDYLRQFEE